MHTAWVPCANSKVPLREKLPRDQGDGSLGGKACSKLSREGSLRPRSQAWVGRGLHVGLSALNICRKWLQSSPFFPSSTPLPHPPKGVLTHYSHWSPEGLVTHQAHTWFQWALDHYMVGEQEKQMKAVVIRQRRSSDLPDKRDCRHVPKCVQAPDMQKLFLITGFISFLPPSPSSTSANVSKSEQSPNQFQVFRETQRGSSVPGSEPGSRTAPRVLQLNFLALSLEQFKSPTLNIGQMAWKRKYLNECALLEWMTPDCVFSGSPGPGKVPEIADREHPFLL